MKLIAFATCLIGLTATARLTECCCSTPMVTPTEAPSDILNTNLSCKTDKANVKIFDKNQILVSFLNQICN